MIKSNIENIDKTLWERIKFWDSKNTADDPKALAELIELFMSKPEFAFEFDIIDIIIAFDFTFKKTDIEYNTNVLLPIPRDLINSVFVPIYNRYSEDSKKAGPSAGAGAGAAGAAAGAGAAAPTDSGYNIRNKATLAGTYQNTDLTHPFINIDIDDGTIKLSSAADKLINNAYFQEEWNAMLRKQFTSIEKNKLDLFNYLLLMKCLQSHEATGPADEAIANITNFFGEQDVMTNMSNNPYLNFIDTDGLISVGTTRRDDTTPYTINTFTYMDNSNTLQSIDLHSYTTTVEISVKTIYIINVETYIKLIPSYILLNANKNVKPTDGNIDLHIDKELFEILFKNVITNIRITIGQESLETIYNPTILTSLIQLYINNCYDNHTLSTQQGIDYGDIKNMMATIQSLKNIAPLGADADADAAAAAAADAGAGGKVGGGESNLSIITKACIQNIYKMYKYLDSLNKPAVGANAANAGNAGAATNAVTADNADDNINIVKIQTTEDNKNTPWCENNKDLEYITRETGESKFGFGRTTVYKFIDPTTKEDITIEERCLSQQTLAAIKNIENAIKDIEGAKKTNGGSKNTYKTFKTTKHNNSNQKTMKRVKNVKKVSNNKKNNKRNKTTAINVETHTHNQHSKIYVGGDGEDSFIQWCISNKTRSPSLPNKDSIANKTIFVKTQLDYNELRKQRSYGLGNDILYGMTDLIGYLKKSSNSNKTNEANYRELLQDLNKNEFILPIIFKKITHIGTINYKDKNDKKVVDDAVLNNNSEKEKTLDWTEVESLRKYIQSGVDLFSIIFGTKTWTSTNSFWDALANSISIFVGGLAAYGIQSTELLAGLSPYAVTGYIASTMIMQLYSIQYREIFISGGITKDNTDKIINDILFQTIFDMLTKIRYIEYNNFNKHPNDIFMYIINIGYSNATAWFKTYTQEQEKANPGWGWGWLDKFKNQFSFTSELKITDSELKSTTIIKNINTTNVSPEIKSKLINLNIPMQSFYYAMSIVKSTANKDNNKLLKLYYDNRDLFMENYKKREAEKMSPKK